MVTAFAPARLTIPVYTPADLEYAAEVATFHTNVVHTPDLVVAAESTADVVAAVHLAREQGCRVSVQSGGHGVSAVMSGLLVTTHRMNQVTVDPATRIATIGGGARWSDVLAATAPHGLLPIIGSSPHVGVVGYLLGGGISPLARSHGFSSDYVTGFTVVTASGEVVEASEASHDDLFWALRGGKSGFGIVTEVRLRLVAQETLYAGSIAFAEDQIETVLRGWLDWTRTADEQVTTSTAIINFPPLEMVPPPFRGKRLLFLRFAYPGDAARGAELAAPLRALAPAFLDDLGEIPATEMARIHNDPTDPAPAWGVGAQLREVDDTFATRWLERFGAGTGSPFVMAELRHGGGRAWEDVPGGSAVTGRAASYTAFMIAMFPPLFAEVAPMAAREVMATISGWTLPEANVNLAGENEAVRLWSPAVQARLDAVRAAYDPEGMFTVRW